MSTVLVVDDMPIFRDPIAASLRLAGFKTLCAANGSDALASIRANRPSVVLLDVAMPVMDGLTCLRQLRADPEIAKTPVILLTAMSDKKYVIEAGKLGVQDYLLKSSFSMRELLSRVVKYTGHPARATAPKPTGPAPTPTPPPAAGPPAAPQEAPKPAPHAPGAASPPPLLTREACVARAEKALAAKTLSGAVAEVIALAASPRGNAADLAPLIARDPVLSARVLQAANSAAYVSTRPVVRTIPDAVKQIGFATVRSIASALGVFDAMPPTGADGFNPIRCWQHSFAVAMLCERLAPKSGGDAGLAYLVGLCHDLGDVLFHTHFGREHARVLEAHRQTGRPLDPLEREMMGMTRGELVQTIIGFLGLPDAIKEPIRAFHEGGTGAAAAARLSKVLRAAELYANGLLLASGGASVVAPLTRADCRAVLGREEVQPPDVTTFRSEVFYTTGALARLSREDAEAVMKPPFERRRVRLWLVREKSLSPFDPVCAALESLAEVTVTDAFSRRPAGGFDGVVALAPSDLAAGFTASEIEQAAGEVPVTWLVGRVNGMTPRDAAIAPQRWPVALEGLAKFVERCDVTGRAGEARRDGPLPSAA